MLASNFDLESFSESVDDELWDFMHLLTQSMNESRGHSDILSAPHTQRRCDEHTYSVLSMLMFCTTNGRCNMPFHVLLADMVEAGGGSSDLMSTLNRVGGIASQDTLNRHICSVSERREKEGLLKDLPQSAFTVASTDNVDIDQPNAAVYAGCQQRSWHGTSVQVVQPQSLKM